jgi:luciferase family oxidoreductase group 1
MSESQNPAPLEPLAALGRNGRVPLSALDLAIVARGESSVDALRDTTALAKVADEQGYIRFWVAEHHNMATVASTTPPVLIAHLAANTRRIRLGSGGVMLPNHPPLVVAEQFAMLEALYPGRIDLGIGRAPGTDQATAAALRRTEAGLGAEDFPQHLIDLMGLLGDERRDEGLWTRFRATPRAESNPWIALLGSSNYSAELAGLLGLPFSFAHHFDMSAPGTTQRVFELYRHRFRPSAVLAEPYAIVSANVLAAPTQDEADYLAGPGRLMMLVRRTGRFEPLSSPEAAAVDARMAEARGMATNRIVGDPKQVADGLEDLAELTGANEVMVTTSTHGLAERIASFELLATEWRRRDDAAG